MLFSARYRFIPLEWLSRRSEPRHSTRSKPDITPWISFSNLAINCCMAFLLGFSVADLDIQQRTPSEERQFPFAACRHAGQLGKLRPIGNRRRPRGYPARHHRTGGGNQPPRRLPTWPTSMGSPFVDRKSTRLNSSHLVISYAV